MKSWLLVLVALLPGGSVILLVAWAWRRWTNREPRVSPTWLLQWKQGARDEYHGVTYSGKFNR